MRFLLLIHLDENEVAQWSNQRMTEVMTGCERTCEEMRRAGRFIAAERLRPTAMTTTLRVRKGQTTTIDGPFIETKEQLGGFYLIEADSRDEALAWAARLPHARYGHIEVRPIWERSLEEIGTPVHYVTEAGVVAAP